MGNWDWQVFCKNTIDGEVMPRCFGSGGDITYLEWLLSAWGWTLSVSLLALVVAVVVGSLMGILRTTPSKTLILIGNAWTELFRNIPLLVQIFLWYHVIPSLFLPLQKVPSFLLVESGRADAFVMDGSLLAGLIARSKNPKDFKIVGEVLSVEPIAIMTRKDDAGLLKIVNATTAELVKSGEIFKIYDKWFMQPTVPSGAVVNLPMSDALRNVLKNPNNLPAEEFAKKVAS